MRSMSPPWNPAIPAQAIQTNLAQRQAVLRNSVRMVQPIFSQASINPLTTANLQIPVQPTGLVTGFLIHITGTLTNTGSTTALSPTPFNVANVLSQITFQDTNNNVRHQTTGWHLASINAASRSRAFMAALTSDSPIFTAVTQNVIYGPSTIPATTGNVLVFSMMYRLPISFNKWDLRGAMYANLTSATSFIKIYFNQNAVIASGDPTEAMYTGNTGTLTLVSVSVYQEYLDRLPSAGGKVIIPQLDISYIYELRNSIATGVPQGQEFSQGMQYLNQREFLSTLAIYDNNGTLNEGTDITYWKISTANLVPLYYTSPYEVFGYAREILGDDFPKGTYYFDHTEKPIVTTNAGNMQLIINASSANSPAAVLLGYEDFALTNLVLGAGSIAA